MAEAGHTAASPIIKEEDRLGTEAEQLSALPHVTEEVGASGSCAEQRSETEPAEVETVQRQPLG